MSDNALFDEIKSAIPRDPYYISHKDLVSKAVKWLRNTAKCPVVVYEMSTFAREIPDAVGFRQGGSQSILVECKASLNDFRQDKNKWFRRDPKAGMGGKRYFLTRPALINQPELPEGWGLLEVFSGGIRKTRESSQFDQTNQAIKAEMALIFSSLRRYSSNMIAINQLFKSAFPINVDMTLCDGEWMMDENPADGV